MLFHAHSRPLDFTLAGKRYVVPHGGEVEIPDAIAYCIQKRGIALTPGPSPKDNPPRSHGLKPLPARPTPQREMGDVENIPPSEAAEELADLTGEDPSADDNDDDANDPDDESEGIAAAEKTIEQLESQGLHLPGRRPKRKK